MQGPFFEDQMRGWFSGGYFNRETNVSTWADGGPQGDWQNAEIVFGASPTRRSSSPPRRAAGRHRFRCRRGRRPPETR